jgi:hypothetical protein
LAKLGKKPKVVVGMNKHPRKRAVRHPQPA